MEFQEAMSASKTLTKKPANDTLLKLYALYKQATEGDVSGEKPGGFDFKAIAKYATWEKMKGKSQEEAKTEYVDVVEGLLKMHK
ncbi:MAG: diazepam-binding inhibitor (GABA receptor modulating acyl-CoA-binding protein) [Arenicella sp.]|jgi:diazepam-binding inhibitor (GABA receptor modulating acyl-CoA-binding protein)